jgi:hypothetical protein
MVTHQRTAAIDRESQLPGELPSHTLTFPSRPAKQNPGFHLRKTRADVA